MKLSVMHVGFGGAVLAGLILAFIGHPAPVAPIVAASSSAVSPNAPRTFVLKSVSVELPIGGDTFPGPDAPMIAANCLACHSAGMVLTPAQPFQGNLGRNRREDDPRLQGADRPSRSRGDRRLSASDQGHEVAKAQWWPGTVRRLRDGSNRTARHLKQLLGR